MRTRRFWTLCLLLIMLVACQGPTATLTPIPSLPPGLAFPRQAPPEGARETMTALWYGTLVEDGGCLYVADDLDGRYLPIWPHDFGATAEDGQLQIHDGSGAVVARAGDWVRLGGGETGMTLPAGIEGAADCVGPYWIVGDEVSGVYLADLPAHPTIAPLLDALARQGVTFGALEQSHAAYLYPEPGIAYTVSDGTVSDGTVGDGWLHLHLFPDAGVAQVRAEYIAHDLPNSIIDWVAPPHFYRCDAVMALYLGNDEGVMDILTAHCGAAFAAMPVADMTQVTATLQESAHGLGKLVYVKQGDLWIKDVPDGQPRRLTAADGTSNFAPRWSPSGTWLAFRKADTPPESWQRQAGGEVWLMSADGQVAYTLPAAGEVQRTAWSPKHDCLAYVDDAGLYIINADDAAVQTLVTTEDTTAHVGTIAWSPDGEWLAYTLFRDGYQGVWKVPVAGGNAVELYDSGFPTKGDAWLAGWTHDGRFVLFWQGDINSASMLADGVPLYALSSTGGEPAQLALAMEDANVLVYPQSVAPAPIGSSEPARIALSLGGGRDTLFNKQVGVASIVDGGFTALSPRGQSAIALSWSPDGGRLAYTAVDSEALANADSTHKRLMQRRIYTVDMGGDVRSLTSDPAYRDEYPLWSADSAYILFPRLNDQNEASLWLVPASGGETVLVVDALSPLAEEFWSGYYGYVEWGHLFDWWQPAPGTASPTPAGLTTDPIVSTMRSVPFTVCQTFADWVRPTEDEQAAEIWSLPRYRDVPLEKLRQMFRQDFYRYHGGNSELSAWGEMGLWNAGSDAHCVASGQATIFKGQEIQIWVLNHRVQAVQRAGDVYTVTVEPMPGFEIVQLPGGGKPVDKMAVDPTVIHFVRDGQVIDTLPR